MAIGNNMLPEIQGRLSRHGKQRSLQRLPIKDIDSHTGQIAPGMFGLFLKLCDLPVLVSYHNAESAGLLQRHRHHRDGDFSPAGLVKIQHDLIVHLIDVIP